VKVSIDEQALAEFSKVATAAYCVQLARVRLAKEAPDRDEIMASVSELNVAQGLLDEQVKLLKQRLGITGKKPYAV
jgi:hypothetical protein